MEKMKILFWVAIGLFFSFLASAISGFWLWFFLPKGIGVRYTWRIVHQWSSLVFTILAIVHLILHWQLIKNWLKKALKGDF